MDIHYDWQLIFVGVSVGVAALYVWRAAWQAWRGRGKCSAGCGCGTKPTKDPSESFIPATSLRIKTRQ